MQPKFVHEDLTRKIIRSFYTVHDSLGGGFLESVYENALVVELQEQGMKTETQKELTIIYKKQMIGYFKADLVVEDKVLVEVKAVSQLIKQHEAQMINYLKATGIKVGLLVNFGDKLEFKRRIF